MQVPDVLVLLLGVDHLVREVAEELRGVAAALLHEGDQALVSADLLALAAGHGGLVTCDVQVELVQPGLLQVAHEVVVELRVGALRPLLVRLPVLLGAVGRVLLPVLEDHLRGVREGVRQHLVRVAVEALAAGVAAVRAVVERVRQLDRSFGAADGRHEVAAEVGVVLEGGVAVVAEDAVEALDVGVRDLLAAVEAGGDVLGVLQLVLLDVALRARVEAAARGVLAAGDAVLVAVLHGGVEGHLHAGVGVLEGLDVLLDLVGPVVGRLVPLPEQLLAVGVVDVRVAFLGGQVGADVALVVDGHLRLAGVRDHRLQSLLQFRELPVRVPQQVCDGLRLRLCGPVLVLRAGEVRVRGALGYALPGGVALRQPLGGGRVGRFRLLEVARHVVPGLRRGGELVVLGRHDLLVRESHGLLLPSQRYASTPGSGAGFSSGRKPLYISLS